MDFKALFNQHKMWFIVGGAAIAGLVLYSFIKNRNAASSATNTTTSGSASPSQYLVPYNAYFNGSQPDGGSTGNAASSSGVQSNATPATTGGPSSSVPINAVTTPAAPVFNIGSAAGSGFLPGNPNAVAPSATGGPGFEYISTPGALTQDINTYGVGAIDTQTGPGIFAPSQGPGVQNKTLPGTPQYLDLSKVAAA